MLSRRLTSSGLLLVFLAGVMCLCGFLGYQHAPVFDSMGFPEAHLSGTQPGFAADDRPENHGLASSVYAATLFAVSLGAALGLMFGVARRWLGIGAVLSARRLPPPIVLPPPRIPARSQLQVFLL
jgi:hypothetical protein